MKRNIVIAAVTAAALVGGGTATALAVTGDGEGSVRQAVDVRGTGDDARADDGARDDDSGRDDDAGKAASVEVTAADAIASALRHDPGTAVSAELDDEDDGADGADAGSVVWKVDVLGGGDTWHSVRVDPGTGKVLGSHTEREDDTAEVRGALKGTSVTAAEAAKAVTGKGTVTSVDLDEDGTSKGWEVETHASGEAEQDWRVDLNSGKVTADRADRADRADDDRADDNDGGDD
ncbi:peptidase propeptide and YpeB domain protein [Streptomyces sp. SA15]|uniref:PepSY domain-containing protein n=1 Tax=Streptomyces sp. SA15 TaxID=934019 RepID=UPI000BAFD80B|nr:PepSY domain-containing protein [Streptomyces sp. SA15]PAZ09828.1 peptidase propeptide and YpeB domain protein [Streptomyces sp. SA15]